MASVDIDMEVAGNNIIDVQDVERSERNRAPIARGSWAGRLDLNHWLLGHLLQRYRMMQHHFPFVVIPEAWNLQNMMMSRSTRSPVESWWAARTTWNYCKRFWYI
jgi:hypothetical protein